MKYSYLTIDVKPEKLEEYLQSYGEKGYRFVQLVVMQRYVQPKLQLGIQQPPQIEIEFKLIFELLCQE